MTGARSSGWLLTAIGVVSLLRGSLRLPPAQLAPDRRSVMLPIRTRMLLVLGAGAGLLLLGWGTLAPSPAVAAGWLIGWLFWLGITVGALILLTIHGLTGGRWATTAWPALAPAAATVPVFAIVGLPLAFVLPALFPWAADPQAAAPGVAGAYLNPHGWVMRAGLALLFWSLLAMLVLRRSGPHPFVAAIGLFVHAVVVTLVGQDWILSADPRFTSSAFGAAFATTQILSALSWLAAMRLTPPGGAGKSGDIGALMMAAALGSLYLGFSQYLVIWYGDIPGRVAWYVRRMEGGWLWLDVAAILLAGVVPFAVLLRTVWRESPVVLSVVGLAVLLGIAMHLLWLVAPAHGAWTALSALLGLVAIGGPWMTLAYGCMARRLDPYHGT